MQELAPDATLYDPKTEVGDAAEAIGRLGAGDCPVVVLTSSLRAGEEAALTQAGAAAILLTGSGTGAVLATVEKVSADWAGATHRRS